MHKTMSAQQQQQQLQLVNVTNTSLLFAYRRVCFLRHCIIPPTQADLCVNVMLDCLSLTQNVGTELLEQAYHELTSLSNRIV